jgi:hypothetical protein
MNLQSGTSHRVFSDDARIIDEHMTSSGKPLASEVCTNKVNFKESTRTSHSVKQLITKWMADI